MKKFLVLYEAPKSFMEQMAKSTPEQAKAGMDAWMNWSKKNSKAVVDFGMPVGNNKHLETASAADGRSKVAGFSILQADSIDSITKILRDHPHLNIPGGSIEVFEFLKAPGM